MCKDCATFRIAVVIGYGLSHGLVGCIDKPPSRSIVLSLQGSD
jgi:hypothetical protein